MDYTLVLIDNPAPHVRRVTLNRPEKRNALNSVLRQEVITAVRAGNPTRTCASLSSPPTARASAAVTT